MPRLRLAGSLRKPAATAAKNTVTYQIGMDALAASYSRKHAAKRVAEQPFKLPEFPPESRPPKGSGLAMDETPLSSVTSWAAAQAISSAWSEGLQFLGYTYLSELAQRAEYRVMSEVIAEEMTRKWIRFQGKGDADKTEKISELTDYLDDMKLQAIFHRIALTDGLMGRAHIYIDTGQTNQGDELQTSIGNGRDDVTRSKLGKGKLRGFKVVEPIWAYPLTYNASDPLADDWYRPELWYAMSRSIHRSRFLTFVGRPVPDILKPAYAFGGLSISQMAKPYVDNWLRTRQSVSDLVHSFTVFKLGTDMSALLMDQGDQLFRRMELFNNLRDNNNLFLHDKETEDFENTSAPLGTLDALLNKSQEQMASVARIPIIKLLGIQPGGLNASSEGEIVTFYDTIAASQERLFRPHLTTCIDFAQISLWGEVDTDIVYVFEPLRALSRKEESEVRKADAEIGQILVQGGVISQEEERIRVASDPDMPYQGLDPNDVPDLQEEEEEGLAIKGAGGAEKAILEGPGGEGGGEGDKPNGDPDKSKDKGEKPKKDPAKDAAFSEGDHPRKDDGKFGSGGGSTAPSTPTKKVAGSGSIERVRSFLKSANLRATVRSIAGTLKANQRAILAAAVVAAITKVAGGYITPELEEMISHEVTTFAEKSGVAVAKARELMQAVATKLVESRSSTAKDSAKPDDVLETMTRFRDGFGAADKGEFKESDHPRKDDGKFGSGGGGSSKKQDAPAKPQDPAKQGADPAKAALVPAALKQPWAKETVVDKEGNVRTSNVNDAARALYEGRKVDLEQPRTVSTLIERLGDVTKHMIALGEDAPKFNLCNVSVKGSNVFCTNNKGIPRIQMPQLDEEQTKAFRKHLKEKGYKVEKTSERASFLRATQNELLGWKVAKQAAKIEANDGVMDKRIVVSRDNYILDGHHHWAGQIGYDAKSNGKLGKLKTKISRVDISIIDLLREADEFTGGKGKKGAGIGDKAIAVDSAWDDDDDWACDAAEFKESDHPRKKDGKFGSGGGSSGSGEIGKATKENSDSNVVFASEFPKGAEVDEDGEIDSDALGTSAMYDSSYDDEGRSIVANVRVWIKPEYEEDADGNIKENDEGEFVLSPNSLVEEEGYYLAEDYLDEEELTALKEEIIGVEQGRLEDQAEEAEAEERWDALTPAEQAAEETAEKDKQAKEKHEYIARVNSEVDKALSSGWRPEFNKHGGWMRPPQLEHIASPNGLVAIYRRMQEKGIALPDQIKKKWLGSDAALKKRCDRKDRGVKTHDALPKSKPTTSVLSKISAALKSDKIATDPPVSEQQRKAMFAAAEGKSNLGIPKEVGKEFVGKAK